MAGQETAGVIKDFMGGAVSAGRAFLSRGPSHAPSGVPTSSRVGRPTAHSRGLPLALASVTVAALALAGCNMSSGTGPQAQLDGSDGPDAPLTEDANWRGMMSTVGADYVAAVTWGDQVHVTNLVDGCYRIQGPIAYRHSLGTAGYEIGLRNCIEEDYLAYKDNQVLTKRGLPGNPYFSRDEYLVRFAHYGMRAGFSDPDTEFHWARDGYVIAKTVENQGLQNRRPVVFQTSKAPAFFGQ